VTLQEAVDTFLQERIALFEGKKEQVKFTNRVRNLSSLFPANVGPVTEQILDLAEQFGLDEVEKALIEAFQKGHLAFKVRG